LRRHGGIVANGEGLAKGKPGIWFSGSHSPLCRPRDARQADVRKSSGLVNLEKWKRKTGRGVSAW
jgi:hypothetical protein